jgi:enoyl-CoA hydratase
MHEGSTEVVTVDQVRDCVYQVTINRPERRNALNIEVKSRVADAMDQLAADDDARVVVITGAGGSFVAGSDVQEMRTMSPITHSLEVTDRMFTSIRKCGKTTIAAVEGYALGGGCELAMNCDMIVAGTGATFGQPEVRLGVMPGAGGTQFLVRALGKYRAMRLLLTGDTLTASEAYSLGLASELTEQGAALERSIQLAAQIAAMPALAVQSLKEAVAAGADLPLEAALLLERKTFQVLFDSYDQSEGMAAFLEKRPPRFEGR